MIEQKTVSIGSEDYVLQEFNTSEGLFWLATLTQLASGMMLGVEHFPSGGLESLEIHPGKALRGLLTHLPAKEFVTLSKQLYRDGVVHPPFDDKDFEERFVGGGGLDRLFNLLAEIVAFNYAALTPTLKKTLAAVFGVKFSDQADQTDEK